MDPWAPADPLAETLGVLRMNGAYYCRSELTAPWGMALFAMPGYLWFHVVVSGRILLETDDSPGVWLEAGDLALVPRGTGHRLRSEAGAAAPDILELGLERVSDRYEVLRHGGGGAPTTLVCGAVRFEHPAARRLVEVLPDVIQVAASDPLQADWTQATLRLMAAEARELRPGGEAAMTRLADVLVIQALRAWLDSDPAARTGWLGALRDPDLGGAIAAVHRDPARNWTVAALARGAAMSRSAFAARFAELVGEPPMQYVTRVRMQLAHDALRTERTTAGELAGRFGYRSEAAFARAFKRTMGVPPGAVRRSLSPST